MDGVTYLKVFDNNGSAVLGVDQESSLDAAVSQYLETGRDQLLHFTLLDGDSYVIRASEVLSWIHSTPQGRAKSCELDKDLEDETKATKLALGITDYD